MGKDHILKYLSIPLLRRYAGLKFICHSLSIISHREDLQNLQFLYAKLFGKAAKCFSNQNRLTGHHAIRYANLIRTRVPELVIDAQGMESLIGNGIPDGKLDKKWQIDLVIGRISF